MLKERVTWTVGHFAIHLLKYSMTRGSCVCCDITCTQCMWLSSAVEVLPLQAPAYWFTSALPAEIKRSCAPSEACLQQRCQVAAHYRDLYHCD